MCGIAGFLGSGTADELRRMCAALHHRGPDAADTWLSPDGRAGFAHARLSVLDHAGGAQPMWTGDGQLGIVFNGEIYNFAELRAELVRRGHVLRSDHSDTEAVLLGYREWGPAVVERLNGMWAFAVLDLATGTLFASRDRFGKKPFYWQVDGRGFRFASELKALAVQRDGLELDTLSLKKYFAYGYIPAPRTLYRGVSKLPAGHNLEMRLGAPAPVVTRWWRFVQEPAPVPDAAEARQTLHALLGAAVARRLVADVPVGTFLSGGIDSSLVTALAARHVPAGRLKTFNITFEDPSFDESAFARLVARELGTDHVEERLSVDAALAIVDDVGRFTDEPTADASILPTYLVSRVARRHVTVALGGDGADELFAGYEPFRALRWARWLHALVPHVALRAAGGALRVLPVSHRYMSMEFRVKRGLAGLAYPPALWMAAWMAPAAVDTANALVQDGHTHTADEIYSEAWDAWRAAPPDLPSGLTQFFVELYLQDDILTKVDRASMMTALEVRAPFLDAELADWVRRLPMDMKLRGGRTKVLLRDMAASLLPPAVVRRGKQGFAVPVGRWFQQGALAVDANALPACIDRAEVERRVGDHRRGRSDERMFLWATLMLQKALRGPHAA